ncbi:hypothetical protein BGX27_000637 [Mortierella sp. AM989]|nr:hypothetical protein BGX27_000637 [Mortierella sp. AM989]
MNFNDVLMDRSLALEGIDSSRKWPSMSDTPRSQELKQAGHRLESKVSSVQRGMSHRHHNSQKQQFSSTVTTTTATTSGVPLTWPSRVKESITKDSTPRKWICKQVPVKTLGGEMMMPIWFSEEDMLLNEPVAPIELDADRMDLDIMGTPSYSSQHHHHHHHHHRHHLMTDDPSQTHTARQKRKMKLKDMALRESRDPQDLMDLPEPMDNKRRYIESHSKEFKTRHSFKEFPSGDKRFKIHREGELGLRKDKREKLYKMSRERSESHVSTRETTPTTPTDAAPENGSPPRYRRQLESNMSSPSSGPRPRPFVCHIEDCGKRFVDALQLERHIERHGPKELECDLDMCGKLFSSIMLLRRHQSMVHKRRSEKWESPPGTARQRSGRSRRREPRIVASGDVMDPAELERQPRGSAEVDQSADDYGEDEDAEEDELSSHPTLKETKPPKQPKQVKEPRPPKQPKEPRAPKEHKPPKGFVPKKLAPKSEMAEGNMDIDASPSEEGDQVGQGEGPAKPTARRGQGSAETREDAGRTALLAGPRPRPFHCTYDDCKKVFIDAIQLERHLERHGPKELECGIDGCRKRFSAQMLLRRHQSMVHKRRSPAVPVSANTGMRQQKTSTTSAPLDAPTRLAPTEADELAPASLSSDNIRTTSAPSTSHASHEQEQYQLVE